MHALLAVYAPETIREVANIQLQPDPELIRQYQGLPRRSSVRKKRLEDALASGWRLNSRMYSQYQHNRFRWISALADSSYTLANNSDGDEASRKSAIRAMLQKALVWEGAGEPPIDSLIDDLLHGKTGQVDREQRRIHRLRERLAQSPVVFIQGETGAGKSHLAAKMAEAAGAVFITSVGPSTDENELATRWRWQAINSSTDRTMVRQEQLLLKWAKAPCTDESYVTLVIDEANLSQNGLLDCLKGLWQKPPCIYVNGHPVPVSERHRVILTGNPESYTGRHLDEMLQKKVQRIFYPALDRAFLQDLVIEPALRQHFKMHGTEPWVSSLTGHATACVLSLWQHYQTILPSHEFTPRDLTDICAWVGWSIRQAIKSGETGVDTITDQSVSALVCQSFRDVLGREMNGQAEGEFFALECWFRHRFPADPILLESVQKKRLQQTYDCFRENTKRLEPNFDTSSPALSELVDALAGDLMRIQEAFENNQKHGGRQATLIEGPTGRGKDATLRLLIDSFSSQMEASVKQLPEVYYLNACDCSWETLKTHIQRARSQGGILVISEMNLIDSQHLEGELNAILTGDAHPGFHLFATTNPPHYAARKPLSPALKGRFVNTSS